MSRAVTFCAIALGIPAVTCAAVSNYMRTHSVLPGIHADNGLECTLDKHKDFEKTPLKGYKPVNDYGVWRIEFLPDNKFRVVDRKAVNDILANDYIGTMTTTDTAYTLGDPQKRINAQNPDDVIRNDFSGLAVDRLTAKIYEHYTDLSEITITGWCTSAYVPARPVPKKL